MKTHTQNRLGIVSAALCLSVFLLAYDAGAQQGFNPGGTTYIGGTNFSWDTTSLYWTPNGTETQVASGSLVAWTNGNVALFCAGPSITNLQGTFTNFVGSGGVSVNGIVLGNDNPAGCNMTLNGPGAITLNAAVTQFSIGGTSGSSFVLDCTIAGTNELQILNNGNSTTSLFGSNTYSGGTSIDGFGAINFDNNASFGTGTITWTVAGFLQGEGTSAINVSNAMTHLANSIETFSGGPGVTFSGPWSIGATGFVELENIAGTITIAGPISGSANLTLTNKGNTGWALTGTNLFSGSLTNAGTLTIGGTGTLGGGSYSGSIFNRSNMIFSTSSTQTLSGVISGTGVLNMSGTSTLTLSGEANTYSGGTILSNGILSVTSIADGTSDIGAGPVTFGGGTLLYTGTGDSTTRLFKGTSGTTSTIDVPANVTVTLNGSVSNNAAWTVNKVDTGTLVLGGTADNSFCGMNVEAGTLILSKTTAGHAIGNPLTVASNATVQFGNVLYNAEIYNNVSSPVTISNGGVLDANAQSEVFYSLNLAGSGIGGTGALINSSVNAASLTCEVILNTNATIGGVGNITLAGEIIGSGPLTYVGSAELSLAGSSSYSGGITVDSGTLDISPTGGSISGTITLNGLATLELDNPAALLPSAIVAVPASPSNNIINLNFTGTQIVSALYVGSTPLAAGIYDAVTNNPNGIITGSGLLSIGQLYWDARGTDASNGTNTFGGGSGSWDNSSSDWWLSGNSDTIWQSNNLPIFAGGVLVKTITLNASETASGLTFVQPNYDLTNTDGVSTLTLDGPLPTVTFPAGTTEIDCLLDAAGTTSGLTATGPGTLLLTGNISGGGTNVGFTATGGGTVVLSGSNTYTNGTLVTGGTTLSVNSIADSGASAISTGSLTLTGGTLSYTGVAPAATARAVTASAATTNAIDVPAGTLTLSGQVEGATLSKTSSGTLILGGVSNDNAGLNLAIEAGLVIITKTTYASAHGLGGGSSTVASNAELQLAGPGNYDLYSGCVLTVSNGGMLDVNGQSDDFSTFSLSGTGISNNGALINSASGTTSGLTNGGSGVVLQGATTIAGPGNITLFSAVSGSGPITYAGTGTLMLTNNNSYSGGTVINANGTVKLTNSVNAAGTGAISDNGTLVLAIVGNNATLTNTISGPGVINVLETSNDNFQLGGVMSGFTGTLNLPASPGTGGSTAKAQILTANVALSSSATINLAAGGTLFVANSGVTIACPINVFGAGNSEAYGALRIQSGALISGPVTLSGNTTIGNGASGSTATISGPISQSNGPWGITFTAEPGTVVLSGTNTYSGGTAINGGVVEIGGAGDLGGGNYAANITNKANLTYASSVAQTLSGVISGTGVLIQDGPGTLTLTQTNTYTGGTGIGNGATLAISGVGSLGAAGTSNNYAANITNNGTFNYASALPQTLSGAVSGTGALTQTGGGTLTLSGGNTYSGPTTIGTGSTLALASTGSILDTTALNIAGASTFDVSAFALSYNLGAGTTLEGSGTGTIVGSTAATIKGGSGANVTAAGPVVLNFTPTSFSGDTTHPALYVSQGALTLTGSGFTVTNLAASPLGVGTYALVQVAGGSLTVVNTNITVQGTGLAANTGPSLSVSNGILYLNVVNTVVPRPGINSFSISAGNIIFSGTNGTPNGTYTVLTTTNVALPLSSWKPVATNTFSGTGTFSVTNAISGSKGFYSIQVP